MTRTPNAFTLVNTHAACAADGSDCGERDVPLWSRMGFEQYHEPADELPQETRTFARMIVSLSEEADAINWYEQRIAIEKDKSARAIMQNAQKEEMKHFSMDLEWLLRAKPLWREIAKGVLLTSGDIVKEGEEAEEKTD
jgi:uncharacterized protein